MPKYRVSLSDGRTFEVEASAPPSEADVLAAIGGGAAPEPPKDERGYLEQVKDRFTSGLGRVVKDPAVGATLGSAIATGGTSLLPSLALAAGGGALGAKLFGADNLTAAKEGGLALAGEGIGRGVMAGAKGLGKLMYKASLRPSMPLQREFGDVAATGLREGAAVSQGGAGKVSGRLSMNSDKVSNLIADAEKAGASPVTTREVAGEFGDVFQQGRRQSQLGRPDPRPAVVDRLHSFDARNPNGIPLTRAQELKSEAQDLASRAYRAEDRGGPLTDLSAASDKAMARGLRKGIETRVPDVGPVNEHSQELIGLLRAIEDATRRNVPGVGSMRTLLGDFAPSLASRGGIALDRTGRSPMVPAAFRTALLAALGQGQE